jgi:serine/threonine-protein kinase
MDNDRNLLFGVLALQADFLDARQFAEACAAWASCKDLALAELLLERGWLTPDDRAHVEYLVERRLKKHRGDVRSSLAEAARGEVRRALASIGPSLRDSLAGLPPGPVELLTSSTVAYQPASRDRYTLSRLHAKGGIGQVWLARDEDLGRDVALKELRPERGDQPAAAARFLAEARITGQLEHPGIVPVYELARHGEQRRVYYTMRFLRGRTLTEATRAYHGKRAAGQAGPLDLRELLGAFVTVCQAVAYAHNRGVIHRDLKGQNVVLGDFGEVMLLDWGLAKVLGSADVAASLEPITSNSADSRDATQQGQVLGTPAYMAPEQAEGRLDAIGKQSDVYGLGAMLYELLTGQPPFDGTNTQEVLRKVIHDAPTPVRQVVKETPPALEAVCQKALAKKPEGRYASAAELARAVQQWLADEPVAAYREPLRARVGRWARRHTALVAAAAALLVTAVVALGISTALVSEQRALAQEQRLRAEQGFAQARQAVDEYFTKVSQSKLLRVPGMQPLRKELLDSALKYYQGFLQEGGDDPALRLELAHAQHRVADILYDTATRADALSAAEKARDLFEALVRDRPGDVEPRVGLAQVYNLVGIAQRAKAPDKALTALGHCRRLWEELIRDDPGNESHWAGLGHALNNMIAVHSRLKNDQEALWIAEEALSLREKLVRADPKDADRRNGVAQVLNNIGYVHAIRRRFAEALPAYRRSKEITAEVVRENPNRTDYVSQLGIAGHNIAECLEELDRADEGLKEIREAIKLQRSALDKEPADTDYRTYLGAHHMQAAKLARMLGRVADAAGHAHERRQLAAGNVDELFGAACDLALCVPLVGKGKAELSAAEKAERERYADQAMDALRAAIAAGDRDVARLRKEPALDPLRQRDDFKALVRQVEAKPGT